jgi:hypothetical protein
MRLVLTAVLEMEIAFLLVSASAEMTFTAKTVQFIQTIWKSHTQQAMISNTRNTTIQRYHLRHLGRKLQSQYKNMGDPAKLTYTSNTPRQRQRL